MPVCRHRLSQEQRPRIRKQLLIQRKLRLNAVKSAYALKIPEPDPEFTRVVTADASWSPTCLSADLKELPKNFEHSNEHGQHVSLDF